MRTKQKDHISKSAIVLINNQFSKRFELIKELELYIYCYYKDLKKEEFDISINNIELLKGFYVIASKKTVEGYFFKLEKENNSVRHTVECNAVFKEYKETPDKKTVVYSTEWNNFKITRKRNVKES